MSAAPGSENKSQEGEHRMQIWLMLSSNLETESSNERDTLEGTRDT